MVRDHVGDRGAAQDQRDFTDDLTGAELGEDRVRAVVVAVDDGDFAERDQV